MSIDVLGMVELKARLAAMKERASNLRPALIRAGMVPLRAAKDHIKSGGPGWAANQSGTPLLFKSGRLINSLTIGSSEGVLSLQDDSIEVGTNVPYAAWMQHGTGVFAGHGRIYPKKARALAFNGRFYRSIAGSPARAFLYLDEKQAELIRAVFANYIVSGLPNSDQ